jgi:hypothetical protein
MSASKWRLAKLGLTTATLFLLLTSTLLAAQVSGTVPMAPNSGVIIPPGPQRQQPPGRQQPAGNNGRNQVAPTPSRVQMNTGTVEGFVYWDADQMSHIPTASCSGLAITVSIGSSSGGPLVSYTPMATLSNNFKFIGRVKGLYGGKTVTYEVCAFGYDHVPVGPSLQVKLSITQPLAFSPIAAPQFEILGPINIVNAQCNMLPRIMNPTVADLTGHWGTCQNMAYGVSFPLIHPQMLHTLSSSGGAGSPSGSSGTQSKLLSDAPQHGMFASNPAGSTQGRQSGGSSGALLGNPQSMSGPGAGASNPTVGNPRSIPGQGDGVPNPAGKLELNPQPLPPRVQMTNADVLKMLKSGVSESVIISSVRSGNHNFDFSPAGCSDLQRAQVSANILNAMAEGGMRPCALIPATNFSKPAMTDVEQCEKACTTRCERSPNANLSKGGCNKTCFDRCTTSRPFVGKFSPPTSYGKLTNPHRTEYEAKIVAVLQQQKLAADQESAEMATVLRSSAGSAIQGRSPDSVRRQAAGGVQSVAPGTVQDVHGTPNTQLTHAHYVNALLLTCANNPTPRIVQVSGVHSHTVFTPEPKFNPYTIMGCGFGPPNPGNSAVLSGQNGFSANLNIDSWSDNAITVHLDPWLAGVMDQDSIQLVISAAGKQPIQNFGYSFYAARGMPARDGSVREALLNYGSVPSHGVQLSSVDFVLAGWNGVPTQYYGGPIDIGSTLKNLLSYQDTPVAGWVFRYAYGHDDYNNFLNRNFNGEDLTDYFCYINGSAQEETSKGKEPCTYFFSNKALGFGNLWQTPGADRWDFLFYSDQFVISSYDLYAMNVDPSQICGAWDDSSKTSGQIGNWDFNLTDRNEITVKWPLYWCVDQEAWPFNRVNATRQSSYGLAVWVWGPRCVDPWTGRADQQCMASVRSMLGS